jgi:hypothetical protein
MTEFKCDTRSHGNFLYGKKQSVFTVLYRLYNHCYTILNTASFGAIHGTSYNNSIKTDRYRGRLCRALGSDQIYSHP